MEKPTSGRASGWLTDSDEDEGKYEGKYSNDDRNDRGDDAGGKEDEKEDEKGVSREQQERKSRKEINFDFGKPRAPSAVWGKTSVAVNYKNYHALKRARLAREREAAGPISGINNESFAAVEKRAVGGPTFAAGLESRKKTKRKIMMMMKKRKKKEEEENEENEGAASAAAHIDWSKESEGRISVRGGEAAAFARGPC